MFNKKYKKGMADAAKAYEAFGKKQEEALNFILEEVRQGKRNIEEAVQELNGNIDNLYEHLKSKEKAQLYTVYTPFDIKELGNQEKLFLVGALYRLTADRTPNERQQNYLRSVQKYLDIKEPPFGVDPLAIENIEDIPTQKAIFQTVLEFLRLQDGDNYDETELQQDFLDAFSINSKGRQSILEHVELLYTATGAQGLSEKYGYVPEGDIDDVTSDIEPLPSPIQEDVLDSILCNQTKEKIQDIIHPIFRNMLIDCNNATKMFFFSKAVFCIEHEDLVPEPQKGIERYMAKKFADFWPMDIPECSEKELDDLSIQYNGMPNIYLPEKDRIACKKIFDVHMSIEEQAGYNHIKTTIGDALETYSFMAAYIHAYKKGDSSRKTTEWVQRARKTGWFDNIPEDILDTPDNVHPIFRNVLINSTPATQYYFLIKASNYYRGLYKVAPPEGALSKYIASKFASEWQSEINITENDLKELSLQNDGMPRCYMTEEDQLACKHVLNVHMTSDEMAQFKYIVSSVNSSLSSYDTMKVCRENYNHGDRSETTCKYVDWADKSGWF